jgi:hypothetical protein
MSRPQVGCKGRPRRASSSFLNPVVGLMMAASAGGGVGSPRCCIEGFLPAGHHGTKHGLPEEHFPLLEKDPEVFRP